MSTEQLNSLTEPLQNIFEEMYTSTDIDLATYRSALNQPSPDRDLLTFIEQMQRVSLQVFILFLV